MSYGDRLCYLKLHSLKGRRLRGDLIQMYKIFHKYDDVDINMLFSDTPVNITRNSDGKLFLKHARKKFLFRIELSTIGILFRHL